MTVFIKNCSEDGFAEQPLHHIKDNVTSDDFAIYLRVNYRPGNQILSFFRNSFSYEDVQRELRKQFEIS